MSKKRRAPVRTQPKHPDKTVTLSYHERMFVAIYRALEDAEKSAVDRSLSYEWAGRRQDANSKLTPAEIQRENERLGHAFRALMTPGESSDALVYFANCWKDTPSRRQAGAR